MKRRGGIKKGVYGSGQTVEQREEERYVEKE
jgi:hypothetical protein